MEPPDSPSAGAVGRRRRPPDAARRLAGSARRRARLAELVPEPRPLPPRPRDDEPPPVRGRRERPDSPWVAEPDVVARSPGRANGPCVPATGSAPPPQSGPERGCEVMGWRPMVVRAAAGTGQQSAAGPGQRTHGGDDRAALDDQRPHTRRGRRGRGDRRRRVRRVHRQARSAVSEAGRPAPQRGGQKSRGGLAQRGPRPVDHSAYRATAHPERGGGLLVAGAGDSGHEQCAPLGLRHLGQPGEDLADDHADLGTGLCVGGVQRLVELHRVVTGPAQHGDRAVVDDAVKPRTGVGDLGVAIAQGHPGAHQRVLEGILGAPSAPAGARRTPAARGCGAARGPRRPARRLPGRARPVGRRTAGPGLEGSCRNGAAAGLGGG